MRDIDKEVLKDQIKKQTEQGSFNLYKFVQDNFTY